MFIFAIFLWCCLLKQTMTKEGWEERFDLPSHRIYDLIRLIWRWGKKKCKLALKVTFDSCPLAMLTKWVPCSYLLWCQFGSTLSPKIQPDLQLSWFHRSQRAIERIMPSTFSLAHWDLRLYQSINSVRVRTWAYHSACYVATNKYLLIKWIHKNRHSEFVLSN